MENTLNKKIIASNTFEDVISENNRFYILNKLDKICILPYTISSNGLLDKIGIIKEYDVLKEKKNFTLINGYISQDDPTNLVCANRLMFDVIGSNAKNADDWMYLGKIDNALIGSNLIIYAVNITDLKINSSEQVEETKKAKQFQLVDSNKVVSSDDALFLASFMRLFNYFYVNSLS